jgi:hypothetical protein
LRRRKREPTTRGDPDRPLLWTAKSLRNLTAGLCALGHRVCHNTVGTLLRTLGYSLQANRKTREGANHPDRDAQFGYLNEQVKAALAADEPAISVDTKKKELIGDFKNGGREWRPRGEPEAVRVHDFLIPGLGRAVPYGVYDIGENAGWVSVGIDHDTASFAVNAIRRWWQLMGRARYPNATRLTITADSGGSNGARLRLWKRDLQKLADELGLTISVCHLPPGTSKWNKIEHRLFSFITQNWRGKPLVSHHVMIQLIAATTTKTGLKVHCELDPNTYPAGVKVTVPRSPGSISSATTSTATGTTPSCHPDHRDAVVPQRALSGHGQSYHTPRPAGDRPGQTRNSLEKEPRQFSSPELGPGAQEPRGCRRPNPIGIRGRSCSVPARSPIDAPAAAGRANASAGHEPTAASRGEQKKPRRMPEPSAC